MPFLESVAAAIPGDPVWGIMIFGVATYLLHVSIRGGTTNIEKKARALKGDLTISLLIVMSTAILARYFIFISDKNYFLLPDVLSIIIAFVFTGRIKKFFGLK